MQTPRSSLEIELELEALTICTKKTHTENHFKPCMMAPGVLSPSASSLIGDYIGMESCFDLSNNDPPCGGGGIDSIREKREQRCRMTTRKKAIPPPIPRHMPWVLKRYYTNDGRLILREEKVRFNEYLRARRSNGRFILDLVPFDDHNNGNGFDDYDDRKAVVSDDEDRVDSLDNETDNINNDEDDDGSKNNTVEDSTVKCPIAEPEQTPLENGIAANGGKCLKYDSVSVSPTCFLGLPVPATRPVHI
ncbi:hypothetical protein like AT1G22110 [Hibiscus trionum]|uniref:FAF domain-containing protein n=1 Tax=Hibiscus trionum TaxID=183268 RepID=A0A9W7I634_HIBTR|nr:hypothetical protein like AT1G22110 [Hibiscus trionum]